MAWALGFTTMGCVYLGGGIQGMLNSLWPQYEVVVTQHKAWRDTNPQITTRSELTTSTRTRCVSKHLESVAVENQRPDSIRLELWKDADDLVVQINHDLQCAVAHSGPSTAPAPMSADLDRVIEQVRGMAPWRDDDRGKLQIQFLRTEIDCVVREGYLSYEWGPFHTMDRSVSFKWNRLYRPALYAWMGAGCVWVAVLLWGWSQTLGFLRMGR